MPLLETGPADTALPKVPACAAHGAGGAQRNKGPQVGPIEPTHEDSQRLQGHTSRVGFEAAIGVSSPDYDDQAVMPVWGCLLQHFDSNLIPGAFPSNQVLIRTSLECCSFAASWKQQHGRSCPTSFVLSEALSPLQRSQAHLHVMQSPLLPLVSVNTALDTSLAKTMACTEASRILGPRGLACDSTDNTYLQGVGTSWSDSRLAPGTSRARLLQCERAAADLDEHVE